MRTSIGSTWVFGLIVIFILIFTAYLAVTVNYSKAFDVKNGVLDIIEEEEGLTSRETTDDLGAIQKIDAYLSGAGYNSYGFCPTDYVGYNPMTNTGGRGTKYRYCVQKVNTYDDIEIQKSYYNVVMFFRLDLPMFENLFTFRVTGETTEIYYPGDCSVWKEC